MTNLVRSGNIAYLLYSVMPIEWLCALARWHGRLTYLVRRGERSTVRRNLVRNFGATKTGREIDALTRHFFEYRRLRGVLLAIAPRLTDAELEKLLPIEGLEHLDGALEQKRGVILLACHLNSLSGFLVTIMLRERGYDVRTALPEEGEPWPSTVLGRAVERHFKTKTISELIGAFYSQFNIRPIVRSLQDNGIVAQTGDGLHSARFITVEFLGHQVPFPTGMPSIAQTTGAVVVPIFQLGAPDRLRVVIEEPWTVPREEEAEGALQRAVAAYARRLEHHLLENIACWEHWLIEDALATIAAWPQKSLKERYEV